MTHKANPVGNEITCIMYGINDAVLNDVKRLGRILVDAANKENFKILKKIAHRFKPYGFTAILMIKESHIAIHTYPEYNCLVFNLYSCRGPKDGRKTFNYFKEKINPRKINLKEKKIRISLPERNEK